jgi:hypothetical protein
VQVYWRGHQDSWDLCERCLVAASATALKQTNDALQKENEALAVQMSLMRSASAAIASAAGGGSAGGQQSATGAPGRPCAAASAADGGGGRAAGAESSDAHAETESMPQVRGTPAGKMDEQHLGHLRHSHFVGTYDSPEAELRAYDALKLRGHGTQLEVSVGDDVDEAGPSSSQGGDGAQQPKRMLYDDGELGASGRSEPAVLQHAVPVHRSLPDGARPRGYISLNRHY